MRAFTSAVEPDGTRLKPAEAEGGAPFQLMDAGELSDALVASGY